MRRRLLIPLLLAWSCDTAADASASAGDAAPSVDLPGLLSCQRRQADFAALAPVLADPLKAVALGWRPLPQANLFMTEYELTVPVEVFGQHSDRIAFSGESIMAVLDLPDPRPLARRLGLEAAIDTPEKAMFGKEVRSVDIRDPASGTVRIESAILSVSNVASHPGKTLAGCSYSLDLPADGEDAAAAAPAS